MQEQLQVEKILSFEEICPVFSELIAENGGWEKTRNMVFKAEDGKTRNIMECKSCIVGEAHDN